MSLHIVIDARRIRDFGIGTYIRSLGHALAGIDHANQYTLVCGPAEAALLAGLPENFRSAIYARNDHSILDHVAFPIFLRGLSPDLVHIPLNRVPLLMIRPYVVTIHDMANLFYEEGISPLRMHLRRYRFRRGLLRAKRVIAVSEATRRDAETRLGVPPHSIRTVYNAPDPAFVAHGGADQQEQRRIMERYQIEYPFLLYAGNIRSHKNVPRLVEAFAVVRGQLAAHPVYKDLRLVIIGDTISQYPAVRQTVIKSRVEHVVRFLGFVPFDTLLLLRIRGGLRVPFALRRFRIAAARSHGVRRAGGHLERQLAAGSGGRCRRPGESRECFRHRARHQGSAAG
jgi:glycosyltransferase involved in cell wall biosynthesis